VSSPSNIYVAVVDDDESLCRSMARLLRTSGMQAITYTSAEAFLADSKRPEFDCLLLDIRMVGMSGIELSQRLATSGSKTPVVFSTAHDEPNLRDEAWQTGCAGYLRKTDSGEAVLSAIRTAIQAKSGRDIQ
jgi:FixJ family two-component response regulator